MVNDLKIKKLKMSDAGFTSLVIILCLFDVFPISDQTSPGYGMYLFIFDFSGLGILSPSIVIIYNICFVYNLLCWPLLRQGSSRNLNRITCLAVGSVVSLGIPLQSEEMSGTRLTKRAKA